MVEQVPTQFTLGSGADTIIRNGDGATDGTDTIRITFTVDSGGDTYLILRQVL